MTCIINPESKKSRSGLNLDFGYPHFRFYWTIGLVWILSVDSDFRCFFIIQNKLKIIGISGDICNSFKQNFKCKKRERARWQEQLHSNPEILGSNLDRAHWDFRRCAHILSFILGCVQYKKWIWKHFSEHKDGRAATFIRTKYKTETRTVEMDHQEIY